MADLLTSVISVSNSEGVDGALDLLYESVDRMLLERRFADVRELVRAASSCGLSVQLLLGVLTITIQCRDEMLDEREMVAAEVRRLRPDESQWEGLLGGLVPNVSGPVASSPGTGQVSRG